MASAIDPTVPGNLTPVVSPQIRVQFATAASEITALQNQVTPLQSSVTTLQGQMTPLQTSVTALQTKTTISGDGTLAANGALQITSVRGQDWSTTSPALNQVPQWNGSSWVPSTVTAGGGTGTVNAAAIGQLAYYQTAGNAVSGAAGVTVPGGNSILINMNTGAPAAFPAAAPLWINGPAGPYDLLMDSYGARAGLDFRRANGSPTGLLALANGDQMGSVGALGYNGTAYTTQESAHMRIQADGAWGPGNNAAYISFGQVLSNTLTPPLDVMILRNGGLSIGNPPGASRGPGTIDLSGVGAGVWVNGTQLGTGGAYLELTGGTLTGPLVVNGNTATPPSWGLADVLTRWVGRDNGAAHLELDSFGAGITGATASQIWFRRAEGTAGSPTPIATAGSVLGAMTFGGIHTAGSNPGLSANIRAVTTEPWSAGAWGTQLEFYALQPGVPGPTSPDHLRMRISDRVIVGSNPSPRPPAVNGLLQLAGPDGTPTANATIDATGVPDMILRKMNGTQGGPLPIVNGNQLGRFMVQGWDGNDFFQAARMEVNATQAWGAGGPRGASLSLWCVPTGAATPIYALGTSPTGGVMIGNASNVWGQGTISVQNMIYIQGEPLDEWLENQGFQKI